jgi:hypothetical protein
MQADLRGRDEDYGLREAKKSKGEDMKLAKKTKLDRAKKPNQVHQPLSPFYFIAERGASNQC